MTRAKKRTIIPPQPSLDQQIPNRDPHQEGQPGESLERGDDGHDDRPSVFHGCVGRLGGDRLPRLPTHQRYNNRCNIANTYEGDRGGGALRRRMHLDGKFRDPQRAALGPLCCGSRENASSGFGKAERASAAGLGSCSKSANGLGKQRVALGVGSPHEICCSAPPWRPGLLLRAEDLGCVIQRRTDVGSRSASG